MDPSDLQKLLNDLEEFRQSVYQEGQALCAQWRPFIQRRSFRIGALNLAYYLALRRRDVQPLSTAFMPWGLSPPGYSEAHVMPDLDAAIATLTGICQRDLATLPPHPRPRAFLRGERLLQREANLVLGRAPTHRHIRIMVTLPSEVATDPVPLRSLMMRGIDCVRINCAHDTPEAWAAMMTHLRRAEVETGRTCTVLMDLAGPKVRTAEVIAPKTRPRLLLGDSLLLTRDRPRLSKRFLFQASCTHPAILDHLQVGAAVWIDDGRIGCRVEELGPQGAMLCVTAVRPKGRKLQADQGLNFPDTALPLPPLTDKDLSDLDFMVAHAHAVGFSFVQQPADIDLLLQEIRARVQDRGRSPALVAKIETMHAIRNLPELIVHAAGQVPFGVMIARGDLAVEIGYQHLAEMQEELLCLCKAAYIPVIWATQVLENLTKQGIPSRAEMTDAAMAERAECVMLNKGPYLAETVTMLDDVLTRMQAYRSRKTAPGRALYAW